MLENMIDEIWGEFKYEDEGLEILRLRHQQEMCRYLDLGLKCSNEEGERQYGCRKEVG